ncbi:MAG: hypothetical protein E7582_06755 [Ruminococcaceae bacterium]|nr:hypothetical protein [Oscillospiraceae bacterium]
MKKILCLILTAIMLVCLCGCFEDTDVEDVRGEISSNNNQEEKPDETESEFSLGKTANSTYSNDFLGISCALPSEWVFYTDEEILALNNIVGDVLDEEVAETLKNADIIYDMFAENDTDFCNMNLNLEKVSPSQLINLDIAQVMESQIDTIKSTYQNMGYTDINIVSQKVTVDGEEFDGLKITAKLQNVDFYGIVFTFRKGNYLANVSLCSLISDKTDTILSYFTIE